MAGRRRWLVLAALAAAALSAVPGAAVLGQGGGPSETPAAIIQAAELGTGFTYQGRLQEGGASATGVYDLRFILFDSEAGGSQVGPTVTRPAVPVVGGLFTTELDFGDGVFSGDGRWLEVAIRQTGSPVFFSVLSPRQPIRAVPYALYARSAELGLPFAGAGTTTSPSPLFSVVQNGSGRTIEALRTYDGEAQSPALYGLNAGAGAGVQGESTAADGIGVRGMATGAGGIGVEGSAGVGGTGGKLTGLTGAVVESTDGSVALEMAGGALKVSGNPRPAFVHTVVTSGAGANLCGQNGTVLDSPLLNDEPAAIVIVGHVSASGLTASEADTRELVLAFGPATTCAAGAGRWVVFGSGPALADGEAFNVLVVNQ